MHRDLSQVKRVIFEKKTFFQSRLIHPSQMNPDEFGDLYGDASIHCSTAGHVKVASDTSKPSASLMRLLRCGTGWDKMGRMECS